MLFDNFWGFEMDISPEIKFPGKSVCSLLSHINHLWRFYIYRYEGKLCISLVYVILVVAKLIGLQNTLLVMVA